MRIFDGLGRSRAATPSVVIVGAGMGGIATGVKLKRAGIDTFTIFEQSDRIGGTWWDNQYPGAEVDVWSHLYCFSFKPYDWSRTHARQPELHRYLEETVDEFGLRPHLRLSSAVDRAVWDEATHRYRVTLRDGEERWADVVVSCLGLLNYPRYPSWPGLEDFAGPKFHTARWEHHHDLSGRTVAVVGTGSTATQIVPELAPIVRHLYLFQREPGWILPKGERDLSDEERARFQNPLRRRLGRWRALYLAERNQWRGSLHRPGMKNNTKREQGCRAFIGRVFKDRPDLAELVTPAYPVSGKRIIFNTTFYPTLLADNVELVPRAVASVTSNAVVDVEGNEYPVDVLVMATGFQPANFLASLEVAGRDGRTIHEAWEGEPRAFLGVSVPNFPNFYMLYGPNTNGGEIVSNLERQAEHVVHAVRRMVRRRISALEVRPIFYERYNRWIARQMADTSWVVANNYYKSPSGRIVTQWPFGPMVYGAMLKVLGPISESGRRVGRQALTAPAGPETAALVDEGAAVPTPGTGSPRQR